MKIIVPSNLQHVNQRDIEYFFKDVFRKCKTVNSLEIYSERQTNISLLSFERSFNAVN